MSVPITKKCKFGPKTVDCVFLGYAIHSVGYRFLIVKSGVPDMHVGTIMEFRRVLFRSARNMVLFMRGRLPIRLSQMGLPKKRTVL